MCSRPDKKSKQSSQLKGGALSAAACTVDSASAAVRALPSMQENGDSRLWYYDFSSWKDAGHTGGIVGIDEAGRGPLAGPVVAAAVFLLPAAYSDVRLRQHCFDIDDSKKLDRPRRETVYAKLCQWQEQGLLRIAAAEASVSEIELHNIIGATALAMQRAVAALKLEADLPVGLCDKIGGKRAYTPRMCASAQDCGTSLKPAQAKRIVTGTRAQAKALAKVQQHAQAQTEFFAEFAASAGFSVSGAEATSCSEAGSGAEPSGKNQPHLSKQCVGSARVHWQHGAPRVWVDGNPMPDLLPWGHTGIVGGDAKSLAIAMASVWAKVTRDRIMDELACAFPHYGWAANSGYGTSVHLEALRKHGPCGHHRLKFLHNLELGSAVTSTSAMGVNSAD